MLSTTILEEDKQKARIGRFEHPDVHVQKRLHILYCKALDILTKKFGFGLPTGLGKTLPSLYSPL